MPAELEPTTLAAESDPGERPRIVSAELIRGPSSSRVEVVLERNGREVRSEIDGVGEEERLLRLSARATIDALERMVGQPDFLELVGIKRIHAFDADVVLVCVRTSPDRRTLIGCVPSPDHLVQGVVQAVLNATNRLVERIPDAPPEASD